MLGLKQNIKEYWDAEPCGTRGIPYPVGSFAYYEAITERRDRLDPLAKEYAQFDAWAGKKVLDVGCGVGTDLLGFAQGGALVTGIDLSPKSVFLAMERLKLYKCKGVAIECDAESIPYRDNVFDFVFNWGVTHHTLNPEKVIVEMRRVLKPEGKICAMVYHKPSLVTLQMYLAFGIGKGNPFRSVDDILSSHHESPNTKAYTVGEVQEMFSTFKSVKIDVHVTSYDLRYWRDKYLPSWVSRVVPHGMGWYLIVRATK